MNKFWNWVRNEDTGAAELIFNGPISEDTWFGDEITPAMFRNELSSVSISCCAKRNCCVDGRSGEARALF